MSTPQLDGLGLATVGLGQFDWNFVSTWTSVFARAQSVFAVASVYPLVAWPHGIAMIRPLPLLIVMPPPRMTYTPGRIRTVLALEPPPAMIPPVYVPGVMMQGSWFLQIPVPVAAMFTLGRVPFVPTQPVAASTALQGFFRPLSG